MKETIQLTVTGKVTGLNNVKIPGVTVNALWNGQTQQSNTIMGSAKVDAWGKYRLTYSYETDKNMSSFSDAVPLKFIVEAGEKKIVVGTMEFTQTTLEETHDIVLNYVHFTNVLSKEQLAIARPLASLSLSAFQKVNATEEQKKLILYVQSLTNTKDDGCFNERTYYDLKAAIFHTGVVFNKKKSAKLYEMMTELGYKFSEEVAAMNFINGTSLEPINDLRIERGIECTNFIDEPAWNMLEEELLAKRLKDSEYAARIQKLVDKASRFILKTETKKASTTPKMQTKTLIPAAIQKTEHVSRLQEKLGVAKTGTINLETFKKLESVCRSHGTKKTYLSAPPINRLTVPNRDMSLNVKDEIRVNALQDTLAHLGHKIDMSEYDSHTFGKTTLEAIYKFQNDNKLPATGKFDKVTSKFMAGLLVAGKPKHSKLLHTHTIRGSVRDKLWKGKKGMTVKVFLQNIDIKEQLLGTGITGKNGFFDIPFRGPVNSSSHKREKSFNVKVRLYDSWKPNVCIGEKYVRVTSKQTYVNFTAKLVNCKTVWTGKYLGIDEYTKVYNSLQKTLGGHFPDYLPVCNRPVANVAKLCSVTTEQMLLFVLSNRLCEEAERIHLISDDHKRTDILLEALTPEVYYGLLRENIFGKISLNMFKAEATIGSSTDNIRKRIKNILIQSKYISLHEFRKAINNALNSNIVSRNVYVAKSEILNQLNLLRKRVILSTPLEETLYTLEQALNSIEGNRLFGQSWSYAVAELYSQTFSLNEKFFDSFARSMPNGDYAKQFITLFRVCLIVRDNLEAMRKTYNSIVGHFVGKLGKYSDQQWNSFGVRGDSLTSVKNQLLKYWTKECFIYRTSLKISGATDEVKSAVNVLLECMFDDDDSRRFDLYNTKQADNFSYKTSGGVAFNKATVRMVQRVRKITSDPDIAAILLNNNLTSASTIYFKGERELSSLLTRNGRSSADAKNLFKRAEYIYAQVLAYYLNLCDAVAKPKKEGKSSPELRNLFGTLDSYAVDEDMTLLGPPAYLTDLLRYLSEMPASHGKTALDVLFNRRSDIGDIKLNSANANNTVPYIDLVCYTLENYILNSRQTGVTTPRGATIDEIRTAKSGVAYKFFANSDVPLLKPYFSLPQTKVKAYLEFLGAPRYKLMEMMGVKPIYVAGEYFGMSKRELESLMDSGPSNVKTYLDGMKVIDLMKSLNMSYNELMKLLEFFDFTFIQSSVSDYADITLQAVTNRQASGNDRTLEEAVLLRRLQKMNGLSLTELLMLAKHTMIGNNRFSSSAERENLIIEVYCFRQMMESMSLSFKETLELLGGECRYGEQMEINERAVTRHYKDLKALQVLIPGYYSIRKASELRLFFKKADMLLASEFSVKDCKYLTGTGGEDESFSLLAEKSLNNYANKVSAIFALPAKSSDVEKTEQGRLIELNNLLISWLGMPEDKVLYLTDQAAVIEGLKEKPVEWCRQLHRISICDKRLTLTNAQFKTLAEQSRQLQTPDFFTIEFHDWTVEQLQAMSRIVALDYEYQPKNDGSCYIEMLSSARSKEEILTHITELSEVNMNGYMPGMDQAYFYSPSCYEVMSAMITCIRKIGCTAADLMNWYIPGDYAHETDIAVILRGKIAARYSETKATEWLRQIEDPIREAKRDVLVAWILQNDKSFTNTAAMTSYFLMDVEMNAVQDTSEIRHALSSIQMFVQRCLLNMETEVTVSANDRQDTSSTSSWSQWAWMKNYRIWEANRKIFLFPENYLELELRDGKSQFFDELMAEIGQNETTEENMEEALLNYLHKLDDVAHLEVCGIYHDQEDLNTQLIGYEKDIWHVVARTVSSPRSYYYRTYDVNYNSWTPWERIEIELDGEQIIPVVYNRRLYIFWLQFTEKALKPEKLPAATATQGATNIEESLKYYEIQLLWTQRKGSGWLAKKISKQKLIHPWSRPVKSYTLKPFYNRDTNNLLLDIYLSTSDEFNTRNKYLNFGLYSDNSALRTHFAYNETYYPWHSSSFVFDGEVKDVLFKDVDGSLKYVQTYLGEDAAAMKKLDKSGIRLAMPQGMHMSGNWMTNNVHDQVNTTNLNVPEYTEFTNVTHTSTLMTRAKAPFDFLISLQNNQISAVRKNALMFFKDNTRIFSVHTKSSDVDGRLNRRQGAYEFRPFYHPYANNFIRQLNKEGVNGIYQKALQEQPWIYSQGKRNSQFFTDYHPTSVVVNSPTEDIDFTYGGAYSVYNWELFFHIPLTIACRLMQDQKFEEAMNWFHYIFNPIDYAKQAEESPECYWVTLPFRENARQQVDVTYKKNGNEQDDGYSITGILEHIEKYTDQVRAWRNNPFKPHIVAQYRTAAYQHQVVMNYIKNLIAWGDMLFREDTMESLNEATMLYMLAGEILGLRPSKVKNPLSHSNDLSYNELKGSLDEFGNGKTDANLPLYIEDNIPVGDSFVLEEKKGAELQKLDIAYFSIPSNDAMEACWDTVADRLYKMRNSLNIDGIFRKLALYEPPIDPALLVRAAAMGVSLKDALSQGKDDVPAYRFRTIIQKAVEYCDDVKALGDKLLAALEKKDAEALSQLRQSQELMVLNATTAIKKQQIADAKETIKQLNYNLEGATIRQSFFANIENMSDKETEALSLTIKANSLEKSAAMYKMQASIMTLLPSLTVGVEGFGGSPVFNLNVFNSANLANAMSFIAQDKEIQAAIMHRRSGILSTKAGYERRSAEWELQAQTAAKEMQSLERQIVGAEIRLAVAELDLENHQLQIENNKAMTEAMNNRFATEKLYNWMANQVISIYFKSYQMAYDLARQAQKCFDYELGETGTQIIKDTHWKSLYKGLMAGESLLVSLHELEKMYMEKNVRCLEMTKHISLAELAPEVLMNLISNGACTFNIPNSIFDMDYPNHCQRRIKNVSISIPCIAGPHTNINCTLTLSNGTYYLKDGSRRTYHGTNRCIATSTAQNDSGMFEVNFNDERYLPFEGIGVESEWNISLPKDTNYFDRTSIADVILNISYTAKMKENAVDLKSLSIPYGRLFNLKSEFPTEWYNFVHSSNENGRALEFSATIGKDRLARYLRNLSLQVFSIWGKCGEELNEISTAEAHYDDGVLKVTLPKEDAHKYDNLYVILKQETQK